MHWELKFGACLSTWVMAWEPLADGFFVNAQAHWPGVGQGSCKNTVFTHKNNVYAHDIGYYLIIFLPSVATLVHVIGSLPAVVVSPESSVPWILYFLRRTQHGGALPCEWTWPLTACLVGHMSTSRFHAVTEPCANIAPTLPASARRVPLSCCPARKHWAPYI